MAKPKILIVNNHMKPGGVQTSLIPLLEYLSTEELDIKLLLERAEGDFLDQVPEGVSVAFVRKPWLTAWAKRRLTRLTVRPTSFRKLLRRRPTIASAQQWWAGFEYRLLFWLTRPHTYSAWFPKGRTCYDIAISYNHSGFAPIYVARKAVAHRKIVWYHHGEYSRTGRNKKRDERLFARMTDIVAVTEHTREVLNEAFPSMSGKITVVKNMVNPSRIRIMSEAEPATAFPGEDLTIVTVSRLTPEKGIDLAIEVAALLVDKNIAFKWYVIGEGRERERLEARVATMGLDAHFHLLGSRTNPYPYMRLGDIYVQPSRVEAHSLTTLEALILEKPIVASDLPPIRETLRDGHLGVLCPPDPELFAEEIIAMLGTASQAKYIKRIREVRLDPHGRQQLGQFLAVNVPEAHETSITCGEPSQKT